VSGGARVARHRCKQPFPAHDIPAESSHLAVPDGLPPGLSAADNEVGWRMSIRKTLGALVEAK